MKIWAVGSGIHEGFGNADGWTVLGFLGLSDLCDKLKDFDTESIEQLALVEHGDAGGYVAMDPPLDGKNFEVSRSDLLRLRAVLPPGVRIIFLGCSSANGEGGDRLFQPLSAIFSGSDVVAYIFANKVTGPTAGFGSLSKQWGATRVDEWSEVAKWYRDGAVVRPSLFEVADFQSHDPTLRQRCGSASCPGHERVPQFCNPYRRWHWPSWLVADVAMSKLKGAAASHVSAKPGTIGHHYGKAHAVGHSSELPFNSPAHPAGNGNFRKPGSHGLD